MIFFFANNIVLSENRVTIASVQNEIFVQEVLIETDFSAKLEIPLTNWSSVL